MSHQMPNDQWLRSVYDRMDIDRSGAINAVELQKALSNGTWKPFNIETVRLMMVMFDRDNSGTVNFDEFSQLWRYVTDWINCFKSFDRDNSGNIDRSELKNALTTFGYRLSDQFYDMIIRNIDMRERHTKGIVNFDDFLYICIQLQTLTAAFSHHDTDHDGSIQITYEQFLTMVFALFRMFYKIIVEEAITDQQILDCHETITEVLLPHRKDVNDYLSRVRCQQTNYGYHLMFVRDENGKVVSILGYRIGEYLWNGKEIHIDEFATHSFSRRRGYGDVLIKWIIQKAKDLNCDQITVDSGFIRYDAHRFYLNHGFVFNSHHLSFNVIK